MDFKVIDGARANASSFSTYKPFFGILQNINNTTTQNLKSNEFDKMLSEEMLAIKQLIYEKEKTIAPTPTLLVKERWQVMDLMSKLNKIGFSDEDDSELHSSAVNTNATINDIFDHSNLSKSLQDLVDDNGNEEPDLDLAKTENVPKEKVIGLRSLYNDNDPQDPYKKCGCKKKSPKIECTKSSSTECTKTTTEYTTTTCPFHTNTLTDEPSEEPPSTPSYITTYTYTTCYPLYPSGNPNIYYSPYYVPYPLYIEQPEEEPPRREKKIKKNRTKQPRYQTAKRHKNYDYYIETTTENTDDYLVNNYEVMPKEKLENNIKGNHIQLNNNADKDVNSLEVLLAADNCNDGGCTRGLYEKEREIFVNRIVNDLKNNYGEAAIKPCFCDARRNTAHSIHSGFVMIPCLFYLLV
ncbi:uncharacterized protein LOC126369786 [Pectinophora gossypiella]|uniref:uncharacterized protein LOC126369786 n=1 Tax=Pectinophora gossypiella TaxID=13191 RepID=UPI00214DFF2D|nr:uncharacterized protein LOC126369786 [Pectinophora gossypiella]